MIMTMLSHKAFATNSLNLTFVWDVWFHSQIVCSNIRLPCLLLIRLGKGHSILVQKFVKFQNSKTKLRATEYFNMERVLGRDFYKSKLP